MPNHDPRGYPLVHHVYSTLTHSDPLDFTSNLEGPQYLTLPGFPHLPGCASIHD